MNSDPARRWAQPIDEARGKLRAAWLSDLPDMLDPEDDADDIRDLRLLIAQCEISIVNLKKRLP